MQDVGTVCTALAMGLAGTLAPRLARRQANAPLRLAMPSGLRVGAPCAESGTLYRTARRLFEGSVYF